MGVSSEIITDGEGRIAVELPEDLVSDAGWEPGDTITLVSEGPNIIIKIMKNVDFTTV